MRDELHTFLFADISGYSTLTELEGDEAAAEIAIRFASEVSRLAAELGAELVKTSGDGVMVHCSDAASAIELGMRLHTDAGEHGPLPLVHAGVHSGPAIARGGDWWGATVNVASRLCDAAGPGELIVSEAARQAAGDAFDGRLSPVGEISLKNITNLVEVHSNHAPEPMTSRPVLRLVPPLADATAQAA
jgi:adenylate cyclase